MLSVARLVMANWINTNHNIILPALEIEMPFTLKSSFIATEAQCTTWPKIPRKLGLCTSQRPQISRLPVNVHILRSTHTRHSVSLFYVFRPRKWPGLILDLWTRHSGQRRIISRHHAFVADNPWVRRFLSHEIRVFSVTKIYIRND